MRTDRITRFDVDVVERGVTICRTSTLEHRPGIVEIYGFAAGTMLELVVSSPGYLVQRRQLAAGPAASSVHFYLARPGMLFFEQGGTPIPFHPAKARHITGAHGQPALLINEYLTFSGELDVAYHGAVGPNELRAIATRYELTLVGNEGGRATFRMKTPDVSFVQIAEGIRRAYSDVTAVEPRMTAPTEIDSQIPYKETQREARPLQFSTVKSRSERNRKDEKHSTR